MNAGKYIYYGLDVSSWLLIGILLYLLVIVLAITIRHLVLKKIICPSSPCGIHCEYITSSCICPWKLCQNCRTPQFCGNPFCCRRRHVLNEQKCWVPKCSCRYFLPDPNSAGLSWQCICCEFLCQLDPNNKVGAKETESDFNLASRS